MGPPNAHPPEPNAHPKPSRSPPSRTSPSRNLPPTLPIIMGRMHTWQPHSSSCGRAILVPWATCTSSSWVHGPHARTAAPFFELRPSNSWALGHMHIFFWVRSSSWVGFGNATLHICFLLNCAWERYFAHLFSSNCATKFKMLLKFHLLLKIAFATK